MPGLLTQLGVRATICDSCQQLAGLLIEPGDFVGIAGLRRQKLECEYRGVLGQVFGDDLHIFCGFWFTRLVANQLEGLCTVCPSGSSSQRDSSTVSASTSKASVFEPAPLRTNVPGEICS